MIEPTKEKFTLRQWRVLKDMSIKELAGDTDLTPRTIYAYEHNVDKLRNAKYSTLERIAQALGVSVGDIFLSPTSEKPKYGVEC